ncbi:MAG: shikimate kinase [Clostridia bacterium]|nr:shikimate kinase [Clostridia bacterium]MBR7032112.1 shikimate kinase [Clostridia bacterium]
MDRFGLLGRSLSHSHSPRIHALLGGYDYSLFEKEPEEAEEFILSGDWDGLNVTIPYKKTAYRLADEVSATAEKCGSVNTLVRSGDKIYGENTDYFGFLTTVTRSGIEVAGKKCLVLGDGGAAGAVRAVLSDLGAGNIVTVSRRGENNYDNITRHSDAGIIVNATPVGMYPENGASPVDLSLFPRLSGVFDLIFNPLKTKLLLDAERLSVPHAGGLLMLVAQAKKSSDLFLGAEKDDSVADEVYGALKREVGNVVLVGMPGCGKTTVGRILALKLGKKLVDTDELIEKGTGETIPEIFEKYGEKKFRDLETEAAKASGKLTSTVVTTGGGIVKRPDNFDPLRQNGTVVYLTRRIEDLAREGRPLSENADLEMMLAERAPLYEMISDMTVSNDGDPEKTADLIIEKLGG